MRRQNHTSAKLLLLLCLACWAPMAQGRISAWHANPTNEDDGNDNDSTAYSRKSSISAATPSILKRVPSSKQQQQQQQSPPSYKSKQKSNRFSAPTAPRKPASKSRAGETEEEAQRRRMWHTGPTFIDGVECMYVHNYHPPVKQYHAPVQQHHAPVGKGKGGSSSEYYYYESGKGKGKGGSSEYYYDSGKGKGGSSSGSKKSGSKRRNLSSASSYGGYASTKKNQQRRRDLDDDGWQSEMRDGGDDDDWRKDHGGKDMTGNTKSKRKLRRYVDPHHYYSPSDHTYFTPYGDGTPYHGGYHGTTGYICRFIDIYADEFSFIESFTFSIIESFTFSIIDSFTFSIVESFTFSIIESFTFSFRESFSFIFIDDELISEAPSEAPSTQFNAIAQTRGIPFIGEHPDDVDHQSMAIGDINVKHIGSGKPPVPGPTVSMVPSQIPSSAPSISVEPTPKPSPPPTPTPPPTSEIDEEGNRFIGIKYEGG